jgi:hypothetical protein
MNHLYYTWSRLYWSRERTLVLFVAMLAAIAAMLILTDIVGG